MFISEVRIENFRIFGSEADGEHLALKLTAGLNLIVGENDSGKTCIIDAIRLVLGTAPIEYFTLVPEDFHCKNGVRKTALKIAVSLDDLSEAESAAFLEYLEVEKDSPSARCRLQVTLAAQLDELATR